MRNTALILLGGLALPLVLAACAGEAPPQRSTAATAIGSTATSGPYLAPAGAHDINRDYFIGADPNFPGGMSPQSRGSR